MSFSETSLRLAHDVITSAAERRLTLATAESCTGGLIGGCLTEIPGSSAVVDRGFIVYSNQAKQTLLGVGADLLDRHGAVSAEVAEAMAIGARERAGVDLAIAVTGIAGPGGATPAKPVGLVHIALAFRDRIDAVREIFQGDRRAVRAATVERALSLIKAAIGGTLAN